MTYAVLVSEFFAALALPITIKGSHFTVWQTQPTLTTPVHSSIGQNTVSRGLKIRAKKLHAHIPTLSAVTRYIYENRAMKVTVNAVSIAASLMLAATQSMALPAGEQVNTGSANFSRPDNHTLNIQQHSQHLSANFQQFNIGRQETVNFIQPNSQSIALNRVIGGNASTIMGALNANGQVFLVNPQGILFSRSAQVNVGGLFATTLAISDEDFAADHFRFRGDGSQSSIVNRGQLEAHSGGTIALAAPIIINTGEISASLGKVQLQSADGVLVEFSGGEIGVAADKAAWQGMIDNQGVIAADGGVVVLDANTRDSLYKTAINNDGYVRATSFTHKNGEIFISAQGGDVVNRGTIDTSAVSTHGSGGNISVYANRFAQQGNMLSDARGIGAGGRIVIWADEAIDIGSYSFTSASADIAGDGGWVEFISPGTTLFRQQALIDVGAGQWWGNGGFAEVSGFQHIEIGGLFNGSAPFGRAGLLYLDPFDIEIIDAPAPPPPPDGVNGVFDGGVPTNTWDATADNSQVYTEAIELALQSGNVTITTFDAVGTQQGDLDVNADIDLDGAGTNALTLVADRHLTINADIRDFSPGGDAVPMTFTAGGSFSITDGSRVETAASILIVATASATITGLVSTQVGSGAISITTNGAISDGGASNTDIIASAGEITLDANGISLSLIDGAQLDIDDSSAATTIIEVDDIDVTNINSASSFDLTSLAGGITFSDATPVFDDITLTAAAGTITLPDAGLSTTGDVTLTADDIVDVSSRDVDITATIFTVDTNASGGTLDFSTDISTLNFTNSGINLLRVIDANNMLVNNFSTTSAATLSAGGTLTIPDAGLNAGGNFLSLSADDIRDVSGRTLDITAGIFSINTPSSGGDVVFDTTILDLIVINGGGNLLTFNEADSLSFSGLNMGAGSVTVDATNSLSLLNLLGFTLNGSGTAALTLTSGDDLTISDDITDVGGATDIILGSTGGSLTISAGVGIDSGGGDITLTANTALVDMADGSGADAGAGKIVVSGATVTVDGLVSTNTDDDSVQVTSASDISDQNGTEIDTAGGVILIADTGITGGGATQSFDIIATKINVTNNVSGDVNIETLSSIEYSNIDVAGDFIAATSVGAFDITVSDITATIGGAIDITANQNLTINDGVVLAAGTDTITLEATTGDATVTGLITNGNISVIAGDEIIEGGASNDDIDATLGRITLQAANGIGDAGALRIKGAQLDVSNSTGGDVNLSQPSGDMEIVAVNAAGAVDIDVSGGGSMTVSGFTASQGLTLESNQDLTINDGVVVDAGAGKISLTSTVADINVTGLLTTSSANDAVTIDAANAINDNGASNRDIDAAPGRLTLIATTGINDLETRVNAVSLTNTVSGTIVINELNNLGVASLVTVGDVTLNAGTSITIHNDIDLDGANGATLQFIAGTDINVDDTVIFTDLATGSADLITYDWQAGNNITLGTTGEIRSYGGNMDFLATTGTFSKTGVNIYSDNGLIDIQANAVDVRGIIQSTSGLANAIQISSTTSILDSPAADTDVDLRADSGGIVLVAATGININTRTAQLSVTNTSSGDIVIDERDGVDITFLNFGGGNAAINTRNSGDLTISNAIDLDGLSTGQTLTLDAAGDLFINANIEDATGPVNNDTNIILQASNTADFANGTSIRAGNGTIAVNANRVLSNQLVSTSSSASAITVTSATDIRDQFTGNDFVAVNGGVLLNAATGINDGNFAIEVNSASVTISNSASGAVRINQIGGDIVLNTSAVDSDLELTTGSGDITIAGAVDLNGANGSTVTLNSANDLTLNGNLCEGGATCNSVDDTLVFDFDATNNISTTGNIALASGGGNITVDTLGDITFNDGDSVDALAGTIAISGNDIMLSNLNSNDSSATAISVISTGSIQGRTGNDIRTPGGTLLQAVDGITALGTDVAQLSASVSGSSDISITDVDDITVILVQGANTATLASSNGDLSMNNGALVGNTHLNLSAANGTLSLPDTVNTSGNVILAAQDIVAGSGRTLDITAQDLQFSASPAAADTTINSNITRLDASLSGANLTLNETNTLQVIDLNGDGSSAQVNNGNLSLTVAAGDLLIADDVLATDTNADGLRSGLIDISIGNGDFTLGDSPASIRSINNVDQNSGGGLGTTPTNQVAIRIRSTDSSDSSRSFILGDGVGSDIIIEASGGDILIDALAGASLSSGNIRSVVLNSDVSISATNTAGGTNGIIDLQNNNNIGPATLLAGTNRNITIIGQEFVTAPPPPPIIPPTIPPIIDPAVEEIIITTLRESQVLTGMELAMDAPASTSVSKAFDQVFPVGNCQGENDPNKKRACAVNRTMKAFLSSMLVGGDIPQ